MRKDELFSILTQEELDFFLSFFLSSSSDDCVSLGSGCKKLLPHAEQPRNSIRTTLLILVPEKTCSQA